MRLLLALAVFSTLSVWEVRAQMSYGRAPKVAKEPDMPKDLVKVEQHLGDQVPLDLEFYDHHGKPVTLKDCVNGKPTVLVLAYYSCPKLCTEVLNGLVAEMKPLTRFSLRAGEQFNVITVSINPKDGPLSARPKRAAYLAEYDNRNEEDPGWWFLTASHGQGTNLVEAQAKIQFLADSVGFRYAADNYKAYQQAIEEGDPTKRDVMYETAIRKTKDYVHPSVIMILTPEGKISQYFHGLSRSMGGDNLDDGYNAEDLRKALAEANGGKIGTPLNRMALSCYAYDDHSATYKLNMGRLQWFAAPFPFLVLAIAGYAVWQARRERGRKASGTETLEKRTGYVPATAANEEGMLK